MPTEHGLREDIAEAESERHMRTCVSETDEAMLIMYFQRIPDVFYPCPGDA